MSVLMEGKAEKSKEKRLTKNSKELRAEETDLERALRKSQKEERKAARRKAKEDKEIERVLEISRLESERSNSTSLMLELRSASVSSSAPKLDVLGAVAQSKIGTERRICPFTGVVECDPDIEEKDSNPDSFLYHNMPLSPDAPPCESKNSDGIDEPEGAKDTDEYLDSDITQMLSGPSIPPADTSMNPPGSGLPRSPPTTLGTPPPLLSEESEDESFLLPPSRRTKIKLERKSEEDEFSIAHLLGTPSEVLSGTPSEKSANSRSGSSSEGGAVSSSDGKSSVDSITITQGLYDSLTNSSDSWKDEEDVLVAMQNLSLTAAKVTINSKLLASVVWKARPPLYDVKELQQAQAKNFEMAQKDMEKRLSSLRATEHKKIQASRQELKKLIGDYEEKIRVLNLRLQAGDALQGDSNDITSQIEAALQEAHAENRNLKNKIKSLQEILNDVFRTGAPLKDDRNPAKSSSHESSASMASVKSEISRRNKRDLSPPSKHAHEDFEFKKPRPRNQV